MSDITTRRRIAAREFTDRIDPRKAFWTRLDKMIDENRSTFITFYGAGGVGKSSLIGKLMGEFDGRRDEFQNVVCLFHDFINGGDYRTILNRWKVELQARGCEFPFFETGDFVLSMKQGISLKELDEMQINSWVEKNKWMNLIREKLKKADGAVDRVSPEFNASKADFTSRVLKTFPGIPTLSRLMGMISKTLAEVERKRRLDDHEELRRELFFRAEERNPNVLNQLLPRLFAQDVSDWAGDEKKLIIFLDTYELLTGAVMYSDQDWWIYDDAEDRRGLLFELPPTLWVIGGRNKIRWTDDIDEESAQYFMSELTPADLDQHLVKALSQFDSDHFLTGAGVWSKELRDRIYQVSGGYPLYLDLCVDIYEEFVNNRGRVPTVEDFGQNRDRIVERLMKYMNDDVRLTVQCLSLLGKWTDDMARNVVAGFDANIYSVAKKFSFIQGQSVSLDETTLEVYQFDRTLQKILLEAIGSDEDFAYLIDDTLSAADEYLSQRLASSITFQAEAFYLKMWAELTARLVKTADELEGRYTAIFQESVRQLLNYGQFTAAEEIVAAFFTAPVTVSSEKLHALFDTELSIIEQEQGHFQEALAYIQSAYNNYSEALGETHPDTIKALGRMINNLLECGQFNAALQLGDRLLDLREQIKELDPEMLLLAIINLARAFRELNRDEEALKLYNQLFETLKNDFGEEQPATISTLGRIADALEDKILIDETRAGLQNRSDELPVFETFTEEREEVLRLRRRVLELRRKVHGERALETLQALDDEAKTLKNLNRIDEAIGLIKQSFELRCELIGENHVETLRTMLELASALRSAARPDEALKYNRNCLELNKKYFGEAHPNTIEAMEETAETLSMLEHHEEAIELSRAAIELRKEVFGENDVDTLISMTTLIGVLMTAGREEEANAIINELPDTETMFDG